MAVVAVSGARRGIAGAVLVGGVSRYLGHDLKSVAIGARVCDESSLARSPVWGAPPEEGRAGRCIRGTRAPARYVIRAGVDIMRIIGIPRQML